MTQASIPKWQFVTGWALSGILALVFLPSAYFKIAPGLRFGGSVGLGDKFAQPQQIAPQDTGPRVHLETKFQF